MSEKSAMPNPIAAAIDDAEPFTVPDVKSAGRTQRDLLLEVGDAAKVWRSIDGKVYATVPVRGHLEHHAIDSPAFRAWLRRGLASSYKDRGGRPMAAGDAAIRDACLAIEAPAILDDASHATALRVAECDGAIYIDLGTPDWSLARVSSDGWSIVPTSPVPILRSPKSGAFRLPAACGDFAPIRRLLRHFDEETFILIISWCVGAMLPRGPYPILVLGGEQGSGKSTISRMLQQIVDPVNGDLLQPPGNDRDLIAFARSRHVLAFDNMSGIRPDMADSFCRLATGGEIGGRALFTDHDIASFAASRPIILNGIARLATRPDLADRAIILRLPPLPTRATERALREQLEAALPATFAALLTAISQGLQALSTTPVPDARMADFARLIVAAEPSLPWSRGRFLQAYAQSRADAIATLAEGDAVVREIQRLMAEHEHWQGTMTELHDTIAATWAGAAPPYDWPLNARALSERVDRAIPVLRALGIIVAERRTTRGMRITLHRVAPLAVATSATSMPESR